MKHKSFTANVIKLILPFILLAVLLLLTLIFIFIPLAKKHALTEREESLQYFTQIAYSTLAYYHTLEETEKLSQKEAKQSALAQLQNIRFGKKQKNTFWIVDMAEEMVISPTSPEDTNVSFSTTDINTSFIKKCINTVKNQTEGIIHHKCTVYANPQVMETKVSYIKLFAPWGWIIGTDEYMHEMQNKITSYIYYLLLTMLALIIIVTIVFVHILKKFMMSEKRKQRSFEKLMMQESKMKDLLEAIPDMILRIDREGVVLDVKDPVGIEPFIDPSIILDERIIDAWPAKIADKVITSIERVFVTGEHQIIEFEVTHSTSENTKIEAHFIRSGTDEILATFRDITERTK